MTEVVVIDNYDSFTYNLVDYLEHHIETRVITNDAPLAEIRELDPAGIVISPGPGHPANERDVGVTLEVLRSLSKRVPTFGVCLGLEAAVYAFGGDIDRAPQPIHGKASIIEHDGDGVFRGLPTSFRGGRYHSLIPTSVPDEFEVSAWSTAGEDRLVMGIRHLEYPIECVQFHPESVLTPVGRALIANVADTFCDHDRVEEVAR